MRLRVFGTKTVVRPVKSYTNSITLVRLGVVLECCYWRSGTGVISFGLSAAESPLLPKLRGY